MRGGVGGATEQSGAGTIQEQKQEGVIELHSSMQAGRMIAQV